MNAHGTSTPPNDRVEALALRRLFGEGSPPVSSTKSMLGHTLGAAGALEAVVCVMALSSGVMAPTINLDDLDPECGGIDHIAGVARRGHVGAALSNSFGFGGHNACLVFTAP